jgi:hypothetical protein
MERRAVICETVSRDPEMDAHLSLIGMRKGTPPVWKYDGKGG